MRKLYISSGILVSLLLVGSCAKNELDSKSPDLDNGDKPRTTYQISYSNSASTKAMGEDDGNGNMSFRWENGDSLYVHDGNEFCGKIGLTGGEGTTEGQFDGVISVTEEPENLSFYYLGRTDIALSDLNKAGGYHLTLANQEGTLDTFSDVVVAKTQPIHFVIGKRYEAKMDIQLAMVLLNLSEFKGEPVTVDGYSSNGVNITKDGSITYDSDATAMTFDSAPEDAYLVLVPGSGITLNFKGKSVEGSKTLVSPLEVRFYTNSSHKGASVPASPVSATDLSSDGTSNCYLINNYARYKFNATVKGNSSTSVGTPAKVSVLWESVGTSAAPATGDVIEYPSLDNGYVSFETKKDGNAVIAVKDASDNILWSWHIWVVKDYTPSAQTYNNSVAGMMDRNLGALNSTAGNALSLGLLYQWGRKDPFPASSAISSNTAAKTTGSWPTAVSAVSSIDATVSNPMTFVLGDATNGDWQASGADTRWSSTKTMYDPCPKGWRVPDGGKSGVWSTSLGSCNATTGTWNDTNKGMNYKGASTTVWYPAAGSYSYSTGSLAQTGTNGAYWGVTSSGNKSYAFTLAKTDAAINPAALVQRAAAQSVRCVSESAAAIKPVTSVTMSSDAANLPLWDKITLTATPVPADANVQTITWSSSNTSVATVDQSGKVTAVSTTDGDTATIIATAYNGVVGQCTVTIKDDYTNLASTESANCYIVKAAGKYKFPMVKGNTSTSVGTVKAVKVLWETKNATSAPTAGDIVNKTLKTANNYIYFTTKTTTDYVQGNAVIAAYSDAGASAGKVLWSWHIWNTTVVADQAYKDKNGTTKGTLMNVNLGAISNAAGNIGANGLTYQWGRKDPFLGSRTSSSSASATKYAYSQTGGVAFDTKAGAQSSDYAMQNPMTFITRTVPGTTTVANTNWLSSTDNTRWSSSSKTINDPCPPGYIMPKGGSSGIWATSSGVTTSSGHVSGASRGKYYISAKSVFHTSDDCYYPVSGYVKYSDAAFDSAGSVSYWWAGNVNSSDKAYIFDASYTDTDCIPNLTMSARAYGFSVRCAKK